MWRKERERFYHGKRQRPLRNFCLSLLLFVCICSAFFSGFGNLPSLDKYIFSGGLSNGKTVFYGTGRKNTDS